MSDVGRPLVSVIVPARDAAGTIGRTLRALAAQDLELGHEVIVVDDGSRDETGAIAARAPGRVKVLRQDRAGPGEARNRGVAAAAGDVLAFTDADCFPRADWLRRGLAALEAADLVQGRVVVDPQASRRAFDHTIEITRETGRYETANLFLRRSLFDRLGGFEDWLDVGFGKMLGEDAWFGWRARRGGARTVFSHEAVVEHAVIARGAREYVLDRRRLVYFPAVVAKMPELRRESLYLRLFYNRRAAAFDAALLGVGTAAAVASFAGALWGLVPLVAAVPYSCIQGRRAARMRRYGPKVAVVDAAADAVGLVSVLWGSLRERTLVA